ncbi:MFS transporter [Nocardia yamanashiensis]|uniref:MFS transporter n=1 Tax=Nocardia yamanashiensis TaxID=209247 RepID=UPI001E55DF68|nr:MFS transporter [Nocardia yamanashiensis]UGT40941.1 MFS transporter [Nocardia yamanashiensis]
MTETSVPPDTPITQAWPAAVAGRADRRGQALWATALLSCPQGIDLAIHSLAMPLAGADLGMSDGALALAASVGTLLMAACMLGAGMLGDHTGRRRVLLYGTLGTALGCLLTAAAPNTAFFLLGRALTGAGTAAGFGMSLALLPTLFFPRELPRAFGLWLGVQSVILLSADLGGGLLITEFGWRAGYLLTAAAALAPAAAGWFVIPDSRAARARRFDLIGVLLAAAALMTLIGGIGQASTRGWGSPLVLGGVIVAVVLLAGFYWWEQHTPEPGFPVALFRSPAFSAACLTGVVFNFGHAAVILQTAALLENYLGKSAFTVVLVTIPACFGMIAGAVLAGRAQQQGTAPRTLFVAGLLCCGLGTLLLCLVTPHTGLDYYALAGGFIGFGVMCAQNPQSAVIMSAAPPGMVGSVGAVKTVVGQLGFGLGLGAMTPIIGAFPGSAPRGTSTAYFHGFTVAMAVTTVLMLLAAAGVAVLMRAPATASADHTD